MCLILFAHQAVPDYPLVVAANRDEFFARPSRHADFWSDQNQQQEILAGKDLVAGGTWLGITRSGRFAAVTNIRDPSQREHKPRSRGELTLHFLRGTQSPEHYCSKLAADFDQFAGYNLLVGDQGSLYYVNNFEGTIAALEPGVYGLSNGLLNSPWPKVSRGQAKLESLLQLPQSLDTDALIDIMADRQQAADAELPNTGVPIELERQLSSTFIFNPDRQYGTRCSTAIIQGHAAAGTPTRFAELNFDANGAATSRHFFELQN
jgi:uncharacterized protein with NRDE domain